jgi:head-tail adaptor
MLYEDSPNRGATLTFAPRTRGGGNAAVGVILRLRVGSVSGLGNGGFSFVIGGASGQSVHVSMSDQASANLSVIRHNTGAGSSNTFGTVTAAGISYLWVDMPTTVLSGSLPTVYSDASGSWDAVSMSGADSPGGTANDLDGSAVLTITNDTAGHWQVERVYVFQGTDRPDSAAEARAVALGTTAATAYTGLVFSAPLLSDYIETVGSATGTSSDGTLDGPLSGGRMLNSTCTILRPKQTVADNTGSPLTTYYTLTQDVPCMVQDLSSSESLANLRQTGRTTYNVYFEYNRDVRTGDRLTWDSATLAVIGPPQSDPQRRHYTMVPCEQVQGGGTT